jgi:hypothetical protein
MIRGVRRDELRTDDHHVTFSGVSGAFRSDELPSDDHQVTFSGVSGASCRHQAPLGLANAPTSCSIERRLSRMAPEKSLGPTAETSTAPRSAEKGRHVIIDPPFAAGVLNAAPRWRPASSCPRRLHRRRPA